jgi:hypothetical protein
MIHDVTHAIRALAAGGGFTAASTRNGLVVRRSPCDVDPVMAMRRE